METAANHLPKGNVVTTICGPTRISLRQSADGNETAILSFSTSEGNLLHNKTLIVTVVICILVAVLVFIVVGSILCCYGNGKRCCLTTGTRARKPRTDQESACEPDEEP